MNKGNPGGTLHTNSTPQKDGSSPRRICGFSLTETLVVTAIIAILAVLLFPNLQNMRDKANSAKCIANLKGIAAAVFLSAGENNGNWVFMRSQYDNWSQNLLDQGYLSSSKSTSCPSLPTAEYNGNMTYGVNWFGLAAGPDGLAGSNVLIEKRAGGGSGSREFSAFNLKAIQYPGKFLLLADSYSNRGYINGQFHLVQGFGMDEIHLRHNNRANILFADGHVGTVDPEDLLDIGWNSAFTKDLEVVRF